MLEPIASFLLYAGVIVLLAVWPAAGILCILLALSIPPRPSAICRAPFSELDRHMPKWQFFEVHYTDVATSPERAFRAVLETTPDEILFYQTLTSIRRLFGSGGAAGDSILRAASGKPLLESAEKGGFLRLAEIADQELLVGASLSDSIRAMMNFTIEVLPQGRTRVRTETRVYASQWRSKWLFAAYWRAIYPGSSLIRYMWLRAIRMRAEGALRY